jgi:RNA-directed DNA polymerase
MITPSKDARDKVWCKVRDIIRGNKTARQQNLIGLLNPVIRGWANYYRHVVSTRAFGKLDSLIWRALWRWARRQHLTKGSGWVKERYFHALGTRCWVFACNNGKKNRNGKPALMKLALATDVKIRRHVKVKTDANPYDPQWKSYFAGRSAVVTGSDSDL